MIDEVLGIKQVGPDNSAGARASDEEIAEAARDDAARFALLYHRYSDRIYRYALARARSPEIAADITGETMLSALEAIDTFNAERGSFQGWLFSIASRRIADDHRTRERRLRFLRRGFTRLIPFQSEPDPETALAAAEDAGAIHRAMDSLSETNREIVSLRYAAGLNSAEIGEVLGISSGAVRMRLSRALSQMKDQLEEDQP